MTFHTVLSPSPVQEAFTGVQWDPLEKLDDLSDHERVLFRGGEENPLEYTLADAHDAEAYAQLLLKVIDIVSSASGSNHSQKVAKLALDQCLPDDEALQLLYVDRHGVLLHYAISKLSDVMICLRNSKTVSISSVFYPSGMLDENWRPLLRIMSGGSRSDPYSQRGAAFCLASIVLEGCYLEEQGSIFQPVGDILKSLVSWITSRLQQPQTTHLALVTPSLNLILSSKVARRVFDEAGGVGYLARHLQPKEGNSSVQQIYDLTYCLWLLSYDCKTSLSIQKHFHRDGAVVALCDLISAAPREKVVRVAISSLRNLADCTVEKSVSGHNFLTEMIGCGVMKPIDRLKEKENKDEEMARDIRDLSAALHETFRHMTRWDIYKSEVESSHLQWGAVHTEKFFRENAKNMEGSDGKFRLVKVR